MIKCLAEGHFESFDSLLQRKEPYRPSLFSAQRVHDTFLWLNGFEPIRPLEAILPRLKLSKAPEQDQPAPDPEAKAKGAGEEQADGAGEEKADGAGVARWRTILDHLCGAPSAKGRTISDLLGAPSAKEQGGKEPKDECYRRVSKEAIDLLLRAGRKAEPKALGCEWVCVGSTRPDSTDGWMAWMAGMVGWSDGTREISNAELHDLSLIHI